MNQTPRAKLILLNGPIGCGKTDLSEAIISEMRYEGIDIFNRRCKDHLHRLTQLFFCVDPETYWRIYNIRMLKEEKNQMFTISPDAYRKLSQAIDIPKIPKTHNTPIRLSLREAMIFVSEVICKPTFGKTYFGDARIEHMSKGEFAIDDSTGFEEELIPAISKLGQDNLLLIRITGRGNFDGDSRAFIEDGIIENTVTIDNGEGVSLKEFLNEGTKVAKNFIMGDA